jgi:ABC-type polysaccharide/polyol phosphate transport system ATPase subunit
VTFLNVSDLSLSIKNPFITKRTILGKSEHLTLLSNISVNIAQGDRVAVIGKNGAGKSTLLRCLCGIYEPSAGLIKHEGKLSMVLNSGLGLDFDRNAFQNILSYGLMKNQSRKSIIERIPAIQEFTGLTHFMEMPLRYFSQGMITRLMFTLATEWPAEILIMDEGIGMADYDFHSKAIERLNTYMSDSSILILASHSESLLRKYCNKAILLHEGRLIATGELEQVLDQYGKM